MATMQSEAAQRTDEVNAAIRKRTRRACDRCSSLRARCDGRQPCRRCEEYDQRCHYARVVARRGRKPGARRPQADTDTGGEARRGSSSEVEQELEQDLDEPYRAAHSPADGSPRTISFGSLPFSAIANASLASLPSPHGGPFSPDVISARAVQPSFPLPESPSHNGGQSNLQHAVDFPGPASAHHSPHSALPFSAGYRQGMPDHHDIHPSHEDVPRSLPIPAAPCTFKCLEPVLPVLRGIVDAELASKLLKLYFVEPGGSLFRPASPYILTTVLRKESVLRADNPRRTTPALLVTMLWASSQEAESSIFLFPGQKTRVCEGLRQVMLKLVSERDRDSWNRNTAGLLVRRAGALPTGVAEAASEDTAGLSLAPSIDDVLAFVILTIVISGGDFKTDCFRWWNKALRLARALGLNREDDDTTVAAAAVGGVTCTRDPACGCRVCDAAHRGISLAEHWEERRRVFWLIFCLDRHLGLSFNAPLNILDDECQGLLCPLPDDVWQQPQQEDDSPRVSSARSGRQYGPPTTVTGIGFFEYFLPLMTILGDVIQLHRRKNHPRFGRSHLVSGDNAAATALVETVLDDCARSIADLSFRYEVGVDDDNTGLNGAAAADVPASQLVATPRSGTTAPFGRHRAQAQLVAAYSSFILHVLHVLLHGQWDAVSMLDNKDGWISSAGFAKCASHSIAASDAVSRILACDPELAFMPYLFGIYLLHGSFILLLFADRMPQIGPNESVERACETIIRAHEICVVTLQTEFQKQFRKVLRSTLYSVRSAGVHTAEDSAARRRALSLYRWKPGFTGLAV